MWTLESESEATLIERKSRFVARARHVKNEVDARAFLHLHRDGDANHHCWAYRIGPVARFQDDGEPSGTAGRPILQAIDGQGLDQVVVLVRRHFGGILLGSGGLMRAYGGAASQCLKAAGRLEIRQMVRLALSCPYPDLSLVRSRLSAMPGVTISESRFDTADPVLLVDIPEGQTDALIGQLTDITSGRLRCIET